MTYILLIWLQPATDGRLMARLITRRRVIKAGLIARPAAVAAGGGGMGWLWASADVNTVGHVPFRQPLTIPTLADSQVDADGRCVFELTAQPGTAELLPGTTSETWGFNGECGANATCLSRRNRTDQCAQPARRATTVHRHGMHLPARFDGGPYQMIPPGATWSPSWTIDQPAATLWYHPHPHGETWEHVNRGLAGMFILNDVDDPATRAIPHEYGVDDIPVIVQDRSFGSSGDQKVANLGDTVLVNGTYSPFLEVTTQAVRLRPPAEFNGWKDTVFLPPGTTAPLAMRFADYNDPHTPYKFHCHRLRHEDRGMMGQFVVVEPGRQPARLIRSSGGHDHGHRSTAIDRLALVSFATARNEFRQP